jgi:methionyl-tRNA formyltransferase
LVVRTVKSIAEGNIKPLAQEELFQNKSELKHAPKIFKDNCKIDWANDSESIRNLIRGLSPYPTAWTSFIEKESGSVVIAKLFFAKKYLSEIVNEPGTIDSDGKNYLRIACKNGWLEIIELQLAGKKRMKIEQLLRGFKNMENYTAK